MALSNDDFRLIEYALRNDYSSLNRTIASMLENDNTAKNEGRVKYYKEMLAKNNDFTELPANINGLVVTNQMLPNFNTDMYYLSEEYRVVADNIVRMDKVASKMYQIGINYCNTTLLYGEPGTGKTSFTRYLANKLEIPYIMLDMGRVLDSYLGNSQKNVCKVFDFVRSHRCLFVIDELDALGTQRGSASDVSEINRVVISLMQNIDRLGNENIVIACTNREDILDTALRRRFRSQYKIEKFDDEDNVKLASKIFTTAGFSVNEDVIRQQLKGEEYAQYEVENWAINMISKAILNGIE